jgi:hypothetical protein
MIGLSEDSQEKEKIIVDETTVTRYELSEQVFDKSALQAEKQALKEMISFPKPTNQELAELGEQHHPYYTNNLKSLQDRLREIRKLLKE